MGLQKDFEEMWALPPYPVKLPQEEGHISELSIMGSLRHSIHPEIYAFSKKPFFGNLISLCDLAVTLRINSSGSQLRHTERLI